MNGDNAGVSAKPCGIEAVNQMIDRASAVNVPHRTEPVGPNSPRHSHLANADLLTFHHHPFQ